MPDDEKAWTHQRWAHLRFSIVGPLLAAPPPRGELEAELEKLAAKSWLHPVTGQPAQFSVSTIQRWYYAARAEKQDPVGVLWQDPLRLGPTTFGEGRSGSTARGAVQSAQALELSTSRRQHPRRCFSQSAIRPYAVLFHRCALHEKPRLDSQAGIRRKKDTGHRAGPNASGNPRGAQLRGGPCECFMAPGFSSRLPQNPQSRRRMGEAAAVGHFGRSLPPGLPRP